MTTEYIVVSNKKSNSGIILSVAAVLALGAFVTGPQIGTLASFTAQSTSANSSVAAGNLHIGFVDATGNLTNTSTTVVANAVPDMDAKVSTITVRNTGSVYAAVSLKATNLSAHAGANLNDVLVINVKNAAGTTVYAGPVSGFTYSDPTAYAAGETRSFTYTITWPSTAKDNDYMNAQFTFDTQTDAVSTGRQ